MELKIRFEKTGTIVWVPDMSGRWHIKGNSSFCLNNLGTKVKYLEILEQGA